MAGADVGGELDGQVDLKEFKTLITFLKVAMCRKDGHYRLKQIGLEGKIMTIDAWHKVLGNIVQFHDLKSAVCGERNASETEREDSSDDDSDDDSGDSDDLKIAPKTIVSQNPRAAAVSRAWSLSSASHLYMTRSLAGKRRLRAHCR